MCSLSAFRKLNLTPASSHTLAQPLEEAARAALNLDGSVVLMDAARARGRLLEFVHVLWAWDRQPAVQDGAMAERPIEPPLPDMGPHP